MIDVLRNPDLAHLVWEGLSVSPSQRVAMEWLLDQGFEGTLRELVTAANALFQKTA